MCFKLQDMATNGTANGTAPAPASSLNLAFNTKSTTDGMYWEELFSGRWYWLPLNTKSTTDYQMALFWPLLPLLPLAALATSIATEQSCSPSAIGLGWVNLELNHSRVCTHCVASYDVDCWQETKDDQNFILPPRMPNIHVITSMDHEPLDIIKHQHGSAIQLNAP